MNLTSIDLLKLRLFFGFIVACTPISTYAHYFCFEAEKSKILLLNKEYSTKTQLMYFPYLKPIQLKFKNTEAIEMAEGRPFEFHDYFDEVHNGKVTGQYEIIHQGTIVYGMRYTQQKTQKVTEFNRIYASAHPKIIILNRKGITCF